MSQLLELSIIGLVIVSILVAWFYRYARAYRYSDDRIVQLTQSALMNSSDWDPKLWKTAIAESIIRNGDIITVKFKLPKVGTQGQTDSDYRLYNFHVRYGDWYGAPLGDWTVLVL